MTSPPTISVVIPTLKRAEELARTLDSVLACDPQPAEIVVVDGDEAHSSRPAVDRAAEATDTPIRHVPSPPGSSRQRNRGLDLVTGNIVLFIDDDVRLTRDALARLLDAFAVPTVVGATANVVEIEGRRVGGMHSPIRKLLPGNRRQGSFTSYGYPHRIVDTDVPRDVELMYGCFMAARSEAARRVRFDENLPGYGLAEDEDFAYRLAREGRIVYRPDIDVRHLNLGFRTMDRRRFSERVVVNRSYLFKKNFPQTAASKTRFALLISILFVHRLLNRDVAGARGIIDGIRRRRVTS
ncbi:MAG TPA: glycosyltransferase [Actinomycetota bacterium]|nr:glycosyltransferase [Actinomycetota bacterium]